jgi:undecaprenyl-diphosphatase
MNHTEEMLFRLLNGIAGQSPVIDQIMLVLSDARTWILAGLIFYVLALRTENFRLLCLFWTALIALACSDFISFEIIKPLIGRERPCWILDGVVLIAGKCGGSYGFTSNHAANAFAVWAATAKHAGLRSRLSLFVMTLSTLISISRVYLGVHFVGDVVGGAMLGITITSALWAIGLRPLAEWIANKNLSFRRPK